MCYIGTQAEGGRNAQIDDDWLFLFSFLANLAKASQGVGFLLNKEMMIAWQRADEECECGGGKLLRIRLSIMGMLLRRCSRNLV